MNKGLFIKKNKNKKIQKNFLNVLNELRPNPGLKGIKAFNNIAIQHLFS